MTRLSGPQEPPSDQSTSRPSPKMDKGKAKMQEYEDDHFDDNESTQSLDSEFGGFNVPIGVKKALTSANEKLHLSTREKNPVSRFAYNNYMAGISLYLYGEGGDSTRDGNIFRSSQGSAMDRSHERGDTCAMQERDVGSVISSLG